jgi:N-acetylmuramoyl-L-alanine amidase
MTKEVLVILDDGHGMDTPGKRTPPMPGTGKAVKENEFNRPVVDLIQEQLESAGIMVLQTAPEVHDVSLSDRSTRANQVHKDFIKRNPDGVSLFVSIHFNAMKDSFSGSTASGMEVFHHQGSVEGEKLARAIHAELRKGTAQVDRGVKTESFHVLRETLMPAALVEAGFMDHLEEANLMLDESFQHEVATEVTVGILDYLEARGVKLVDKSVVKSDEVSDWAKESQAWVMEKGISDGTRPRDPVTREEVWVMMQRVHQETVKEVVEGVIEAFGNMV